MNDSDKKVFYIVVSFLLVIIGWSIPNGISLLTIIGFSLMKIVIYFVATHIIIHNFELKKKEVSA